MLALNPAHTRARAPATPPPAESLVGADLDDVRARFGPPLSCTSLGHGETWLWAYRNADGRVVTPAVTAVDEVVIVALDDLRRTTVTEDNRWLGARIEELLAALGPGRIESRSPAGTTVRFGKLLFDVVGGRVRARLG